MTAPAPALIRRFLDGDELDLLNYGRGRIARLRGRNRALSAWYDGKAMVQHIGKAISPEFSMIQTVVGWPGTVVDVIGERCSIDYIDMGDPGLTQRMGEVWDDNEMPIEHGMTQTNSRIHGVSFVVVGKSTAGQTTILPTSATKMTAIYDRSIRDITGAVGINTPESMSSPEVTSLYLPDKTISIERKGSRWLITDEQTNTSGIVPVARFVNRPRLDDDAMWGRSLITPAVISTTQTAARTLLSMEVAREVFIMPFRYVLNADPSAFEDQDGNALEPWQVYWGNFAALTGLLDDEDPDAPPVKPEFGQLAGQSPSGLVEMMKMGSQMIAAETGIPPSNLGFITENPPSGDGMRMYENRLILRSREQNRGNGTGWARTARLVALAEGVAYEDLPRPRTRWHDPATYTPAAAADAMSKIIASKAVPADSDVALERMGFDRDEVSRIKADRGTQQHVDLVSNLALAAGAAKTDPAVAAAAAQRV